MKNIYYLFAVISIVFSSSLNAQWVRSNGPSGYVYSLVASDTNLFAGNNNGKIFRSTDNGTSWTVVYNGLAGSRTDALAISDTNLFAANSAGVLRSTNNGTSWTAVNSGLTGTSLYIVALFVSDTNLFAGTWGSSAFRSTNNGTTWTSANNGLTSNNVHAFADFPNWTGSTNLFAGTYFASGVYLSTDNGGSWIAVSTGLTNSNVRALAVSDTNLFAGTDGGGVFYSTNNGTSWTVFNTGLTNNDVNALFVYGTNLFAGTGDGVWRRPLLDITGIEDPSNEIPSRFILDQNYPNPFNPSTKISYIIPERSNVSLKVFNLLGSEVASLVNEEKSAGVYEVDFNAATLPSGVYFYKLQAGSFVEMKKMILLK